MRDKTMKTKLWSDKNVKKRKYHIPADRKAVFILQDKSKRIHKSL